MFILLLSQVPWQMFGCRPSEAWLTPLLIFLNCLLISPRDIRTCLISSKPHISFHFINSLSGLLFFLGKGPHFLYKSLFLPIFLSLVTLCLARIHFQRFHIKKLTFIILKSLVNKPIPILCIYNTILKMLNILPRFNITIFTILKGINSSSRAY